MSSKSQFPQIDVGHDKLRDLQAFWEMRRNDLGCVKWRDFDPEVLMPWMGHLVVVDVHHEPRRYYIRLYGTQVVEYVGRDITGRYMDEALPDGAYKQTAPLFDQCCDAGQPVYDVYAPSLPGATVRRLHRLALPFVTRGSVVAVILEGIYVEGWEPGGRVNVCDMYNAGPAL